MDGHEMDKLKKEKRTISLNAWTSKTASFLPRARGSQLQEDRTSKDKIY
jgi:hypothetical protein